MRKIQPNLLLVPIILSAASLLSLLVLKDVAVGATLRDFFAFESTGVVGWLLFITSLLLLAFLLIKESLKKGA